ncbi:MAG: hypothetical protein H0W46_03300 [Acidimicrobiia bacterium]|nr:hypothetical protein [Acidimicrobiia bacterium]
MHYVPYHRLEGRANVVVDGSPTHGTVLTVTHWPGYPPPPMIAADLSAQMAFRLIDEHPELVPAGVDVVTNNHFDQDGLVSIFALVDPAEASARRAFMEDVAAAGDFATCRGRDAARASMAIAASAAGDDDALGKLPEDYPQRCALLYTELLGRLPELCADVGRYERLWAEEDATLTASLQAIERGTVRLEEIDDVDLAVVTVDGSAPSAGGHRFGGDWAHGLHPIAVHAATERLVVATVRDRTFEVELRYESWVQLRSRPLRLRRDLQPLAGRLQDEERSGAAVWTATPVGALTPRLSSTGESSILPTRFVELLANHLRTAPPAWDPFRPIARARDER